jgi:hypothetical protein
MKKVEVESPKVLHVIIAPFQLIFTILSAFIRLVPMGATFLVHIHHLSGLRPNRDKVCGV